MLKMRKLLCFLVDKNLDNAPNMLIKPFRLGGLFWLNDFFLSNARLNKAGRASKLITLYHRQDQCDEKAKQEKPHSSLPPDIPSRISLTTTHSHMRKHKTGSIRSNTTPLSYRRLHRDILRQLKMADINKAKNSQFIDIKCSYHRWKAHLHDHIWVITFHPNATSLIFSKVVEQGNTR